MSHPRASARPLAAVSGRAHVDRAPAVAPRAPRRSPPATSTAVNVPLNESGAMRIVSRMPAMRAATPGGIRSSLSRWRRPYGLDRRGRTRGADLQSRQGGLPRGAAADHQARPGRYYLALAEPAMSQLRDRPTRLKRFSTARGRAVLPEADPRLRAGLAADAEVTFPSGRTVPICTVNDAAHLVWGVNLGVIGWNPSPAGAPELDRPDELRVDLDPTPEASWDDVRQVALVCREVLCRSRPVRLPEDERLAGAPRIRPDRPQHDFMAVRRAALALAREVERRAPDRVEQQVVEGRAPRRVRQRDQNIRDRTLASAYSVRPTPDARVSTPLSWEEVPDIKPAGCASTPWRPGSPTRRSSADMDAPVGHMSAARARRLDEEDGAWATLLAAALQEAGRGADALLPAQPGAQAGAVGLTDHKSGLMAHRFG